MINTQKRSDKNRQPARRRGQRHRAVLRLLAALDGIVTAACEPEKARDALFKLIEQEQAAK